VPPKGFVCGVLEPKPPKAGFCPKTEELPNEDDELPNAGVEEAPKAGAELPKAGEGETPKAGVEVKGAEDWVAPNTPVEVPPKMEPPVCEPKGVVLPKGLGANGLLLALLVCPKTDWDPKGLFDDCPKGLVEPNIVPLQFLRGPK